MGHVFPGVIASCLIENAVSAMHFLVTFSPTLSPITSNHHQSPPNHHQNHEPITFQSPLLRQKIPVYCFHVGLRFSKKSKSSLTNAIHTTRQETTSNSCGELLRTVKTHRSHFLFKPGVFEFALQTCTRTNATADQCRNPLLGQDASQEEDEADRRMARA